MKLKDLTGKKFGQLTVLYKLHNYSKKRVHWLCACACGSLTEVRSDHLVNNKIISCGCNRIKHSKYKTRLYKIYNHMITRCYNEHVPQYKYYGGRGIVVCDEWKDSFLVFYDWAINNGYQDNLSIDRINTNGEYGPSNCKWSTAKQQQRNRRNTKYVTYRGETKPLADWCELLNLNRDTVYDRIYRRNWPIEKALELEKGNA